MAFQSDQHRRPVPVASDFTIETMGRLAASFDYESLRNARISENQARLVSLRQERKVSELRAIASPAKPVKTYCKKVFDRTSLRRSNRLKGKSEDVASDFTIETIERLAASLDYESIRNARILQNKARLVSLGLDRKVSELRAISATAKPVKIYCKKVYDRTSLRRSDRLKGKSAGVLSKSDSLRRSELYVLSPKVNPTKLNQRRVLGNGEGEEEANTPANAPRLNLDTTKLRPSPEVLSRRCDSKDRGSVYDPIFGICCHFCRQKKLCGEEDCKRCGHLDMDEPCLGKTDCSVCHSSNGVLCRGCLKVRYGEEIEEVRENKNWMCPHCIEEKGINPNWICNSSFCLRKRKMVPTGVAIYEARKAGYKSVAHLLMDKLEKAAKCTK